MDAFIPMIKEMPALNPEPSSASIQNSGDYCVFEGRKYAINERIEDGCERICKCVASSATVECEPRCPKQNDTSATNEKCLSFPDPKDSCCHIKICDVTLDDHEQGAVVVVPPPPSFGGANKNGSSNGLIRDHEELIATTETTKGVNANKHDSNEKYDCEHNGSKYTIGTRKVLFD